MSENPDMDELWDAWSLIEDDYERGQEAKTPIRDWAKAVNVILLRLLEERKVST